MTASSEKSAFWRGFRDGAPFLLVVGPFGLLFGVVGAEAGLNLAEVMGFSLLVIAGASQFSAVHLMTENAPVFVVLLTALAVNLRMAMYSASLAPHLGQVAFWKRGVMAYFLVDQVYALAIAAYDNQPAMPLHQKVAYYAGVAAPVCLPWYLTTWLGATLGRAIPPEYALDFAVPITFLALITPMLRSAAHVAAATVSVVAALALAFIPYGLGLLIAAALAMVTGAQVELLMLRRAGK